ncbi:MAG: hypothetical protein KDA96_10105, partial [Planctomycetaceae bacterium]|nr:hypothetical protein [Planctomycetaceae bacterium]
MQNNASDQNAATSPRRVPLGDGRPSGTVKGREINFLGLLSAFQRKCVPALALGIPAALLITALVWEFVAAKFQTFSVLKIDQFEKNVVYNKEEQNTEFHTFVETQKALIRSRPVITAALRDPRVSETQTLRGVTYPIEYLMAELEVDNPASPEFVQIGLEGEYPAELKVIIDAITHAYLEEEVYVGRNERARRLAKIEEKYREVDQMVKTADENIDKLAKSLGGADPKVVSTNQQLIQNKLMDLNQEMRELNGRIRVEQAARQSLRERGLPTDQATSDELLGLAGAAQGANDAGNAVPGAGGTLKQQLLDVRARIQQFETHLRNPNHPDLLALKKRERDLLTLLTGTTGTATPGAAVSRLDILLEQRDRLQAEIDEQQALLEQNSNMIVELERATRSIDADRKQRDDLYLEIQRHRVELDRPERISLHQEAHVPEKREIKKKMQYSLFAGFMTLAAFVAGFTLFEWFSHRVGSVSDVTGEIGLRVIGTLPSPDKGGLLGLGVFSGKVDYEEWNRAITESMDVVRTYLLRHVDPSRPASVL